MSSGPVTIYGIDLGTTYSCIAKVDEFGQPVVIKNAEGEAITPSVVLFEGNDRVVGKEAKNCAQLHPETTVAMVKRQMGQPDWRFTYHPGGDPAREETYSAEEISSFILRKLVLDAKEAGEDVTDVVITCPAYFGVTERQATQKAGELAGLNVRKIVSEPTAAAVSYGLKRDEPTVAMVYDLGGGTFDVTIIEIKAGEINTIVTGGDHQLGGKDWDAAVVSYLADRWKEMSGSDDDPTNDPVSLQDLWDRAEAAKRTLSSRESTDVAVTHVGLRQTIPLTRDKFDELTADLLEKTLSFVRATLEQAERHGHKRFDRLLLVGGSTRMKQVSRRLRDEFGADPLSVDPDEAVAKGAALLGQKIAIGEAIDEQLKQWDVDPSRAASPDVVKKAQEKIAAATGLSMEGIKRLSTLKVAEVASRSFGIEVTDPNTRESFCSNLIQVNDRVPLEKTKRFATLEPNQEVVELLVKENIAPADKCGLDDCREIGKAILSMPPRLPAGSPIEVTFKLDPQGMLQLTGRDLSSQKTVEAQFATASVISDEEFAEAKERGKRITVS
jgi:molecular chaperone DnaK (HSP70)